MNSSTKILIASFTILACSIGFFAGSIFMNPGFACKRHCPMMANGPMNCPRMAGHGPHMMDGKPMPPPPPQGMQPDEFKHHKDFKGPHHKGPHGHDFHKNMENHIAEMDSVMQMTPEQKEALKANRAATDSTFKVIGKQKMEADKAFREALESGDAGKINAAKAQLLVAEEAMINQRAVSFTELAKILSPEQREKFRTFRKEKFQR